jgi:hypothetical protein
LMAKESRGFTPSNGSIGLAKLMVILHIYSL